ncbi:MAG: hypothetical protein V7745_05295 [Pseudomonadales bacterium]
MAVYKLDKLMDETRRLAAEYRRSTGSTLPVSAELAKFDAIHLLGLRALDEPMSGVDALRDTEQGVERVQIKGRVIFDAKKTGQRVGQLNLDADWDEVVLVMMNEDYQCTAIFSVTKTQLLVVLDEQQEGKNNARGALSVKKFQAIAEQVWAC